MYLLQIGLLYNNNDFFFPIKFNFSLENHDIVLSKDLGTVLHIEVVNSEVLQWNLSIKDTLGPWKLSFITIEVANSEVAVQ